MPVFLDSNIVLYAFGDDVKGQEARRLLGSRQPVALISTQVLNECSHVMRRKLRWPVSRVEQELELIMTLADVVEVGLPQIRAAWRLADRYGFSHYDSLIVATALSAGCRVLYTEDMQHGQLINGCLTLCNPFVPLVGA